MNDKIAKKKDRTPPLLKVVRWLYPRVENITPSLAHRYFVRLFFTPFRYPVSPKERKAETFAHRFTVVVAGKKVQCYSWGEGIPVLVIHGWAGRATQFRRFVKPLNEAGYRVVGFDGPAHGHSEGKKTDIREFEEAILKISERTGPPVAIIAHSFGGGAALYAAMKGFPIGMVINIATPTIGDEILNTYLKAINGSESTKDYFRKYMVSTLGKSFDQFTSSFFVQHLAHPLELLLIHDEDDKEVDIKHAENLLRIYPAAELLRTKGLGHTRILRDDNVIKACVTFIKNRSSKD